MGPPAALDIDAWNTLPEPREASDFPYLPAQLALKVCWLRCKERVPIDSSGASVQALRIETLRLPRTDDYWVARTLGVVVESRAFLPNLVRGNGREQGTTKVVSCQLSKYLLNLAESEALKPTSCALEEIEVGKHHLSVDIALEHDSLISVGVDGVSTSANGICGVAARRAPTSGFIERRGNNNRHDNER